MGMQESVKREADAARALVSQYRRAMYGQPGYQENVRPYLGIDQEFTLARRRLALIDEEHSATWIRSAPRP